MHDQIRQLRTSLGLYKNFCNDGGRDCVMNSRFLQKYRHTRARVTQWPYLSLLCAEHRSVRAMTLGGWEFPQVHPITIERVTQDQLSNVRDTINLTNYFSDGVTLPDVSFKPADLTSSLPALP